MAVLCQFKVSGPLEFTFFSQTRDVIHFLKQNEVYIHIGYGKLIYLISHDLGAGHEQFMISNFSFVRTYNVD